MKNSLVNAISNTFTRTLRHRFALCELCDQPSGNSRFICAICFNDLPLIDMSKADQDLLNIPEIYYALPKINFDTLVCLSTYSWPFDRWISELKYQQRFELGKELARLFAKQLLRHHWLEHSELPQVLIPVPLHHSRLKSRMYNQATLIANSLSQQLNIPLQTNLITRIKPTTTQVGLTGAARRKNLRDGFEINNRFTKLPKHVALIDDVLTTGTTVSEIAKLLKLSGVEMVTVMTICIAI